MRKGESELGSGVGRGKQGRGFVAFEISWKRESREAVRVKRGVGSGDLEAVK